MANTQSRRSRSPFLAITLLMAVVGCESNPQGPSPVLNASGTRCVLDCVEHVPGGGVADHDQLPMEKIFHDAGIKVELTWLRQPPGTGIRAGDSCPSGCFGYEATFTPLLGSRGGSVNVWFSRDGRLGYKHIGQWRVHSQGQKPTKAGGDFYYFRYDTGDVPEYILFECGDEIVAFKTGYRQI